MTESCTATTAVSIEDQIKSLAATAEQALQRFLPPEHEIPTRLHQAMCYAVVGGGKRVRPVLTYATGQALSLPKAQLHGPACALELIHAYSLIHDDLPAMDNDDLRRGRPTCHIAFDDATAILAGDALQALAFEVLLADMSPEQRRQHGCDMVLMLAKAAGHSGMAGGQAIDLAAVDKALTLTELEQMHRLKTGALIEAAVMLPAVLCDSIKEQELLQLQDYAAHIGLAFQIRDDILDAIADTKTLGKPQGADLEMNKPTYYSLLGLEGARDKLHNVHQQAIEALANFDQKADLLRGIADYIVERSY